MAGGRVRQLNGKLVRTPVRNLGAGWSGVPRAPGKSGRVGRFEETGTVGGHLGGGGGFERPARFLRPKAV